MKLEELIARHPALEGCKNEIQTAAEMMLSAYRDGGKILACGNGGSCADADHIVGELMKGFLRKRSAATVCPSSWRRTDESTANAYARGEAHKSKKSPAAANGCTEKRGILFKMKIPFRGRI